jgi:uncharacterized protein with GYD domain
MILSGSAAQAKGLGLPSVSRGGDRWCQNILGTEVSQAHLNAKPGSNLLLAPKTHGYYHSGRTGRHERRPCVDLQKNIFGGGAMPKYLIQASYSADGLKGLKKDKASGRKVAVSKAVEALGGKLESMYFCFGDHDVIVILDLPNNVSASAFALAVSAAGIGTKTTPLLTIEEADKALQKSVKYQPPGK